MSDLLFACPKCSKSLVIDEIHSGIMVKCTDCQFPTIVPLPVVRFQCSSCQTDLAAPRNVMGKIFQCCNCSKEVSIPTQIQSKIKTDEPKPEPPSIEPGVKLPTLDEESRKRMIKIALNRNDKLKAQLKKAHEPKIIKFAKRVSQYAVITLILWLLAGFMFNDKIATVVLGVSISFTCFIFLLELVLFSGVSD